MKSAAHATLPLPTRCSGASIWCKFNSNKVNSTDTYKPGPGLSEVVVYKVRPVFKVPNKVDQFEK